LLLGTSVVVVVEEVKGEGFVEVVWVVLRLLGVSVLVGVIDGGDGWLADDWVLVDDLGGDNFVLVVLDGISVCSCNVFVMVGAVLGLV